MSHDPRLKNPDPAFDGPWGTQRLNRRGEIMGGNSDSGRPGGPEGSAWKDEAGNDKQEKDAEAIKRSNDVNLGE